jgi:hypothetical protein
VRGLGAYRHIDDARRLSLGYVFSPGDLLAGVTARLIGRSAVLPGQANAIRVTGRIYTGCARHVDAALARWPAIEVRRNRPRPACLDPGRLCLASLGDRERA